MLQVQLWGAVAAVSGCVLLKECALQTLAQLEEEGKAVPAAELVEACKQLLVSAHKSVEHWRRKGEGISINTALLVQKACMVGLQFGALAAQRPSCIISLEHPHHRGPCRHPHCLDPLRWPAPADCAHNRWVDLAPLVPSSAL